MAIKTYKKGSKTKLSDNFKVSEFACKGKDCCSSVKIDSDLVTYLQKIRDHFEKSITITSAYRCSKHNKAVGGSSKSNHTKGKAADIVVNGVKPIEVAKYAESIGVKGIGLYDTFVHIDTRTTKFFWYSDKQEPRSTFGGTYDKKKKPKPDKNVLAFQKAAIADGFKLKADGIWGKESIATAKKAICKKQLIGYKNKNLTKLVQNAVGIKADGKFGTDTKNAVIKWQKRMGIVANGKVEYNTWKKILGVK